jgi:type IV pilus assembly protein PilA
MRKWLKHLKNQKGLTLIELLAVVVILGIIAAIAVPAIGNIIDNSKDDAHRSNALLIINAAKLGIASGEITTTGTTPITKDGITLTELVTAGVLDAVPSDPSVDGQAYDPAESLVTYTAPTNSKNATYKITLIKNAGTTDHYYSNVTEANLNKGVNPKTP